MQLQMVRGYLLANRIIVPNVTNAEIRGTVYREKTVNWMCVLPHALETAPENILTDGAFCCAVTHFCVVTTCMHIP